MGNGRQSRLESFVEKVIDLITGVILAYLAWRFVVPVIWPQYHAPPGEALGLTLFFTGISLVRGYFWRRFFNNQIHLWVHNLIRQRWMKWTWGS